MLIRTFLRDFALIFTDAVRLQALMQYFLYEVRQENINFYKENENDKMIKVLVSRGNIKEIPHNKFLHAMNVNIIKHCLWLLSKYHRRITTIQLDCAMRTLNEFRKTLKQTDYLRQNLPKYSVFQLEEDKSQDKMHINKRELYDMDDDYKGVDFDFDFDE